MNLNKVLKKMKLLEKKSGGISTDSNKKYPTSKLQKRTGFHAKADSLKGASRQRSMGNRNVKTG